MGGGGGGVGGGGYAARDMVQVHCFKIIFHNHLRTGTHLLTWTNFNPCMDKQSLT